MGRIWVYVLELEEGKFLVDRTYGSTVAAAVQRHKEGMGGPWTRRYPVVRLHSETPSTGMQHVHTTTLWMMAQHGTDKVRGGHYLTLELSDAEKAQILIDINTSFPSRTGAQYTDAERKEINLNELAAYDSDEEGEGDRWMILHESG